MRGCALRKVVRNLAHRDLLEKETVAPALENWPVHRCPCQHIRA